MRKWILLLGLGVAGCGTDSSGFAGLYMTTEILAQTGSCGGTGSAVIIDPTIKYFQLSDDDLFGVPLVGWHDCTTIGACDANWNLFESFAQDSGQWTTKASSASGSGPSCTWSLSIRTLTRIDASTIRITSMSYTQSSTSAAPGTCTTDEAKARGTSMPCVSQRVQTAQLQ